MALQVHGTLTIFIERCRNVHASADPYACVKLGKRKLMTTHTIGNTAFPVWEHEDKVFLDGKVNKDTALTVQVYDSDGVTSQLLGEHRVPLEAILGGPVECPKDNDKGFELTKKDKSGVEITLDTRVWFRMSYEAARADGEVPKGVVVYNIENFKNDPKQGIWKVNLIGASHLPKTDTMGRCDPFAAVSVVQDSLAFKKRLVQSKVIGNTYHARWEEVYEIFVSGIFLDDTQLQFAVYDKDTASKDDLVGTYTVPIYNLFKSGRIAGKFPLEIVAEFAKKVDVKHPPTIEFEAEFTECEEAPPKFKLVDVGDLQVLKWRKEGHKGFQ